MSSSVQPFDPYREWLGIEPREQPANFYRLLGLPPFEIDPARIAAAADQRMALVRSFQTGPRGVYTQRLLNEIAAARITLLSPANQAAYDAALTQHLAARAAAAPMQTAPAVLTFGLGQTTVPASPPILPPPAPLPPAVTLQLDLGEEEEPPPQPARQSPWWRPLAGMIGVSLLVLAAVAGYGLNRSYFDRLLGGGPEPEKAVLLDQPSDPEPPPEPKPPQPIVLLQEGSGEVAFSPATAVLSGAVELQVNGTEEFLANWTTAEDAAEWRFKLVKPGFFQAEIVYATIPEAAGAALELTIGERTTTVDLRSSGGFDQFIADTESILVSSTAEQTLVVRPLRQPAENWLVLRSVRLISADRKPPLNEPPAEP